MTLQADFERIVAARRDDGRAGRRRHARRLFVWLQYLLPQHGLSRLVLAATRVRMPWFKNLLIRGFLQLFSVDMSEAVEPDPYRYAQLQRVLHARPAAGRAADRRRAPPTSPARSTAR